MANKAVVPTSALANPPVDGHVTTMQVDSHTKLLGDIIRGQQIVSEATLVAGIDPTLGEDFLCSLTAGRVMGLPIGGQAGQRLHGIVTQGGAGGFALTFAAGIIVKNFALNMAAGDKTDFTLTCLSPTSWLLGLSPLLPSIPASARAMLARNWKGLSGLPSLIASPPAVTLSAANAGTALSGSPAWKPVSPTGTYIPGLVTISGAPISLYQISPFGLGTAWTEEGSTFGAIEFWTESAKFEIVVYGNGQRYRILVNGQLVTAQASAAIPSNGSQYRILLDFAGLRAMRLIRCEFATVFGRLSGIQIPATDTLTAAPRRGPRVIVVGDSFSESTNATDSTTGWTQTLSWLTGWDCWPLAEGGTGYLQPNSGAGRTKAGGHLADITNNAPDLVLWALGINDYNNFTPAAIQAEATADYLAVQAALPNVPQIALGPFSGTGSIYLSANWIAARNAISAAAAAAGIPFADPMGTGYLNGTGKVGATTGDGSADFLVSNDGTHPSQAGHDALARVVASTVAAALTG